MLKRLPLLIGLAMQAAAQAQPPPILYIFREFWKSGHQSELNRIEVEAARTCIALKAPHAWLGIESVTGPKEVWYLNGFTSKEDQDQVREAYSKKPDLLAAMGQVNKRRAQYKSGPDKEGSTQYRPELNPGSWSMGEGRFLVITVTKGSSQSEGAVFEMDDGTRLVVSPARTLAEANRKLSAAGPEARIFAVRPEFSMPAPEWVAADRSFWRSSMRDK